MQPAEAGKRRVRPRPKARPGGTGAKKPPQWSAERRASPGARTVKACLRGDARGPASLARERVPRSTPAPVGAPLPSFARGIFGKPRRSHDSRERRSVPKLSPPSLRGASEASPKATVRECAAIDGRRPSRPAIGGHLAVAGAGSRAIFFPSNAGDHHPCASSTSARPRSRSNRRSPIRASISPR